MMVFDQQYSFTPKSLCRGIVVVIYRLGWIFRITTTSQEVAGSSPAGPASLRSRSMTTRATVAKPPGYT